MTSIQTPIGGWHRQPHFKTNSVVLRYDPWYERLIPDGRHGFGWQVVALLLIPITAFLLAPFVYIRGLLKGEEW